ncbi:MAG: hypothetical protein AUG51_02795 [Acidobacteria bacterium 13_1_20CM_3_53_8]|nr:MAG: hypothetical protein AUG51_02795 [Acidobacteria bacterium 13_1_20CM_3_53_8]
MSSIAVTDINKAILQWLKTKYHGDYKGNIIGTGELPGTSPVEHSLGVVFNADQRHLASQCFDQLKAKDLIRSTHSSNRDPENWVKITDVGLRWIESNEQVIKEYPASIDIGNPMRSNADRLLRIFLCHASCDKPIVRELYQLLKRDGFDPWLDEENLLPGQDWNYEIPIAVRNSDVVVVCLSQSSVTKAGYVQKEIKFALDVADEQPEGAIFIIPTKLEDCTVPVRLRRWHWVNLYEANGYERLLASLLRRANDLGIGITTAINDDDAIEKSLYDEEETLEGNTHIIFPCDLEEGERINIDLISNETVDVLIMDEGDYQQWKKKGEVNLLYKEFSDREQLHAFFTAPVSDKYLVIVRNNTGDEVGVEVKIRYAD